MEKPSLTTQGREEVEEEDVVFAGFIPSFLQWDLLAIQGKCWPE